MQKPNGVFNPGLKKFWPKFHWHWTHLRCFSVFSQILVLQIWKIFSSCDRLAIKIICRFKVPRPAFKQRGYLVLFPGFLKILDKWWQHLLSPRFRREYFKWQGAHSREFGAWGQTNRSGKIYLHFFFEQLEGKRNSNTLISRALWNDSLNNATISGQIWSSAVFPGWKRGNLC